MLIHFLHLVNLSYGSCSLDLNHASVVSDMFDSYTPLSSGWPYAADPSNRLVLDYNCEYSHGSCPSHAWTRRRWRPCRPWCERWPAMTCELRIVKRTLEPRIVPVSRWLSLGNSKRQQLHPISFFFCPHFPFPLTVPNIFVLNIFWSAVKNFQYFHNAIVIPLQLSSVQCM